MWKSVLGAGFVQPSGFASWRLVSEICRDEMKQLVLWFAKP